MSCSTQCLALTPRGRGTIFIGLATFVLAALAIAAFILVREAAVNVYAAGDRDVLRLFASLERFPLFGKRAVHWFVRA